MNESANLNVINILVAMIVFIIIIQFKKKKKNCNPKYVKKNVKNMSPSQKKYSANKR